jgi:hypothetical protein
MSRFRFKRGKEKDESATKLALLGSINKSFHSIEGQDAVDPAHVMYMHLENPDTAKMAELMIGCPFPVGFNIPRLGIEDFVGEYSADYFFNIVDILKKSGCESVIIHAGVSRDGEGKGFPMLIGAHGYGEIGDIVFLLAPRITDDGESGVIVRYKEYLSEKKREREAEKKRKEEAQVLEVKATEQPKEADILATNAPSE